MELSDDERLRRFEALVHTSPDFIAIASVDAKVQFLNRAGRELVGLGDEIDLSETSIADYLTEEGLAASVEVEQPAVARDGWWSGESSLRDWRGGPPIPVAVTSFLITDLRTGEPIAMATIQRDLRDAHRAAASVASAQDALADSERRQRALLLHMSDVLVVVGDDGTLLYASPSAGRVLGYPEGTRVGGSVFDLVHPDDRAEAVERLRAVAAEPGGGPPMRLRLLAADGRALHYEARANNQLHEPSIGGVVITARDVSDQHRSELAQLAQARVLELIAGEAPVEVVFEALAHWVEQQLDDTHCSVMLTDGATLQHGASPSLPVAYHDGVDGLPVEATYSPCATAVRTGAPVLVPDLLADGVWSPFHDLARRCGVRSCWSYPVRSPTTGRLLGTFALYQGHPGLPDDRIAALIARASHLVGIAVDRQELLARLAHQARHDALTGLPNRPALLDRLTASLDRAAETGRPGPVVVFLDLDRLKIVNDSLGHELGDELLVRTAERLAAAVPPHAMVARFGGDEFVVVVGEAEPDAAAALTTAVLAAVAEPVVLEERLLTPSASAGVVIATPGQSAVEVLRDADIAMYRAKHRGGAGYALFDAEMRRRAFDRLDLEAQLRSGLSAGEFLLHFQPVVDLGRDDAVVGFEALVRWQHPERGLLGPDSFIALAEETGLIVPLGEWVLRTAAETVRGWGEHHELRGLTLAVNLAAKQLAVPGLVDTVRECMATIAPATLALELTESTVMAQTALDREVIDELAAAGAALSVDDFGTGYSSLSYLSRLPVKTLKIDRSFVADLGLRPEATSIAAAVVSLADQLELTVVAEGIETAEQRDLLAAMGCRYGQGFLFGRPAAADDAARRLA